eukprot:1960907-Pyramimonas_sp.AAC.1
MPLGIPGLPGATFSTDLIGNKGSSSSCPGLMPLPSMVDCSALVACGVFDNRDGIMIISAPGKRPRDPPQVALARILYTDSNHYFLPPHRFIQSGHEIAQEQAELWKALQHHWSVKYQRGVQANIEWAFNHTKTELTELEIEGPPPQEAERTGIGLVQDSPASSIQVNQTDKQVLTSISNGTGGRLLSQSPGSAAAALFAPDLQGFRRLKQNRSKEFTKVWMSVPGQKYSQD